MGIQIAICDDEKAEIDYLTFLVNKWVKSRNVNAHISSFSNAESFLFHYSDNKAYDINLLDIQMGELSGIELAKRLRKENNSIQIIFITGFPDFMAEGYDVSALHYLLKPVKEEKLFEVLDKAKDKLKHTEKSLFLTVNGEMCRILLSEILYIEACGHYIVIKSKKQEYRAKMNLSDIQKLLGDGFFRCQRSFIVNLVYINKITRTMVVLEDKTEVPLSRNLYDAVNRALIEYFP